MPADSGVPPGLTHEERARLGNEIYAAVFPLLARYETRGYNAHHAAQRVIVSVEEQCDEWVAIQQRIIAPTTNAVQPSEGDPKSG